MRLALFAATILALTMSGAGADIIDDRQANMKERGSVMRILGPIAQGQQPFDAETVLAALERLNENALGEDDHGVFPPKARRPAATRAPRRRSGRIPKPSSRSRPPTRPISRQRSMRHRKTSTGSAPFSGSCRRAVRFLP